MLNGRTVIVEEPRHREVRVDGNRGIVPLVVDVMAEDLLPVAQDVVDAREELVVIVLAARDPAQVIGAGLIGKRLVLIDD